MAQQTELGQKLLESCRIAYSRQQWQRKKQELEMQLPEEEQL